MSWEYKTLDQLGTISRGRSKHRPRNDAALFGGKYPFVQTADVKAANLYLTEYSETYNERGLEQSKLWSKGTLCITIAANIADTAILGIDACFPDSVMGFTSYEGVSNIKFVKYAFDILQRDCQKISQGTAQDNLSWKKLSTIKFPAPDIKIQNKIADILFGYDDLIENNQRQIKLLEEAAQRLYKEWFVDLRFPGYESVKIVDGIPEGWKKDKISNFVITSSGGTPSRTHPEYYVGGSNLWVKTKELSDGFIFDTEEKITDDAIKNSSAKIINKGSILMAMYGATIGKLGIATTELTCNQACCVFDLSNSRYVTSYLYLWLRDNRKFFISQGKGAAQSNLSQAMINNFNILFPSNDVLLRRIAKLQLLNIKLIEARDRLLPKLMNGELKV
jgi:type I restriction enzyme S subunit